MLNGKLVIKHSFSCLTDHTLCPFQIKKFEKLESDEERIKAGKEIYDQFIMKELLSQSHVSTLLFPPLSSYYYYPTFTIIYLGKIIGVPGVFLDNLNQVKNIKNILIQRIKQGNWIFAQNAGTFVNQFRFLLAYTAGRY